MDRRETILAMFDPSGFGLEIGPSYNPLLPKAQGYNVETIDYADDVELRRKYADNPTVDTTRIEAVDYVSDGRPMRDVIGASGRYDFIVASHVIEHTPDLIGFLQDCESLLKPAGVLVLAVPDKRCCFDVFQRLTSTGDVLDAHRSRRTRPSFGSIFDAVAYGVKQDGATGWPKGSTGSRHLVHTVKQAHDLAIDGDRTGRYVDVHVWRFVPSSFELILKDLFEIGEIAFRIVSLRLTDEFVVVLSRDGRGSDRSDLELLSAALEEHSFEHVASIRRANDELERERSVLLCELSRVQGELAAGRDSLAGIAPSQASEQIAALRAALETTTRDVEMLRASTSWKMTGPLRALIRRLRD